MMRSVLLMLCLFTLPAADAAADCILENQREVQVGTSKGVAGECSNSGARVRCISDGENTQRLSCEGPLGTYSGPDMQALIATACGCSAASKAGNEVTDQLQQAIEN
jgi:hypothetical protein